MVNSFSSHVASLAAQLEELTKLQDTQLSADLLRACFGICKVVHLLRMVPPQATKSGAVYFGEMVEETLKSSSEVFLIRFCLSNHSVLSNIYARSSPFLGSHLVQLSPRHRGCFLPPCPLPTPSVRSSFTCSLALLYSFTMLQ